MANVFDLNIRKANGYVVVRTDGYLNQLGGELLSKECLALINSGYNKLVVNFKKTGMVNSIGISILIDIIEKLQRMDGALYFCCLTSTIARTFKIMGLTQFSQIFPDEQTAIAHIQ